jgi:tetratricopeptide (TPR) repeat protein
LPKPPQSSVSWVSGHRSGVVRWAIIVSLFCAIGVGALVFWNMKSRRRRTARWARRWTPTSGPLAQPGAPPETGVYANAADRSKAANKQFLAVAQQYGWLPEGAKAHYFVGITDQELGQTAAAETELKAAAGLVVGDRNLSNLAKLALAGIYHQTNRDAQAIEIYNELAAKPSETVSASVAKLDLADLYAATGKQDQARKLWAEVKDSDKAGRGRIRLLHRSLDRNSRD